MKKFALISTIIFSTVIILHAQQTLKERLFSKVNELFSKAKTEQADLLSPTLYAKAVAQTEDALKDFERGKGIEKKLIEIETLLQDALENAKLGKVTFPYVLTAREDALEANSPQYAYESYNQAEQELAEAAKAIESGDVKRAKDRAAKSEKMFREAELLAIKSSIIGSVRKSLQQAIQEKVDKFAPLSIANAQNLLNEAETILIGNRSAKSEARQKAEKAEYEVKHAFFLASKIRPLKETGNYEQLILDDEQYFSKIVEAFDFEPKFDDGFEKSTSSVVAAIKNFKSENKRLTQEVTSQNEEIEKLTTELNEVRQKLTGVQAEVDLKKKKEARFKKIEDIFLANEAKVLREGDKVTVRLVGLNFRSGKADIDPEYFSLLSKVQRAIQVFPDYGIDIEGHTDNMGNDQYNEKLSMNRASAIREYLIANMGLGAEQITAIGYGENKPIASNDSEDGRAKNRRIDIVLSPKF